MSEREHDERPDLPGDLDLRDEAENVRGGTTAVVSNIQKDKAHATKATVDNLR